MAGAGEPFFSISSALPAGRRALRAADGCSGRLVEIQRYACRQRHRQCVRGEGAVPENGSAGHCSLCSGSNPLALRPPADGGIASVALVGILCSLPCAMKAARDRRCTWFRAHRTAALPGYRLQ